MSFNVERLSAAKEQLIADHRQRLQCAVVCIQTAALEIQPDRRASLRQNGTGGGRVFAGWIWRGLALLASH